MRDKTIRRLYDETGARMRCQHFVRNHGACLDCASRNVAIGCARSAVYPDKKCFEHTQWLAGDRAQRAAADSISGRQLQETARYWAWKMYSEPKVAQHLLSSQERSEERKDNGDGVK